MVVCAWRCVRAVLLSGMLSSAVAVADPAPSPADPTPAVNGDHAPSAPEVDSARTLQARRHFKNGIKLYRDADYRGALAEFEAAYREKPGAGSLQNTALSLKALFRYAEAADTLRLLLSRHASELSEGERRSVRTALDELASLVATLSVSVEPSTASVTLNARLLSVEERTRGVPLNVGEYTLVAEAPGYARKVQVVRIASQQRLSVPLRLQAITGFLEVEATDTRAAIAVNGEPLAYHRWSGPVPPDVDLSVQVYRPGFEPFETTLQVELGETARVAGVLGPPTGEAVDTTAPLPRKPAAPPTRRQPTGFYGLFALTIASVNDVPLGLQISGGDMPITSLGARAGYRLSELLSIEAALDFGKLEAKGTCLDAQSATCEIERDFSLSSVRFGPNLRLLTRGDVFRFAIATGAGIVSHELELQSTTHGAVALPGGSATGVDPYFCLELSGSFNYRHLLFELGILAVLEGASELRGSFDGASRKAAFESETLPLLGLSLKVGYSAWSSKR